MGWAQASLPEDESHMAQSRHLPSWQLAKPQKQDLLAARLLTVDAWMSQTEPEELHM